MSQRQDPSGNYSDSASVSSVVAPAGTVKFSTLTPAPITTKLYNELVSIAKSPEMKELFERNGADPAWTTPAELTKLMQTELDKYSKVIKAANIKL